MTTVEITTNGIAQDLHVTEVTVGGTYREYRLLSSGGPLRVFDYSGGNRQVSDGDATVLSHRLTPDEKALIREAIDAYYAAVAVAREQLGIEELERQAIMTALARLSV
jgi:hypothetical protein